MAYGGMDPLPCVMVEVEGPDPKAARAKWSGPSHVVRDGTLTISCSGVALLVQGVAYIVCPLSVLVPFLEPDARKIPTSASVQQVSNHVEIRAVLANGRTSSESSSFPLKLVSFRCMHQVHTALQQLLAAPSTGRTKWKVGWSSEGQEAAAAATCTLCVLKPSDAQTAAVLLQQLLGEGRNVELSCKPPAIQPGCRVEAYGAAFGTVAASHFNALHIAGILSAQVPEADNRSKPALWLSDLPTLPGMEGGPVVVIANSNSTQRQATLGDQQSRMPLGVLLAPLLVASQGAEASLIAPLDAVLHTVREAVGEKENIAPIAVDNVATSAHTVLSNPAGTTARGCCVAVRSGGAWASGFLVTSRGHILTVAHLFGEQTRHGESVGSGGSHAIQQKVPHVYIAFEPLNGGPRNWVRAEVVYIFHNWMDLAVVQVKQRPPGVTPGVLADSSALCAGSNVVVAGCPSFHPAHAPFPSAFLTAGSLAKVVSYKNEPAMLLTSASVKSGASGGALISAATGKLLGLVTSNTRHMLGSTYPKLNFVLPSKHLQPIVDELARMERNIKIDWSRWDKDDPALSRLWNLGKDKNDSDGPPTPKALKELLEKQAGETRAKL